jgi:hypothetical protein
MRGCSALNMAQATGRIFNFQYQQGRCRGKFLWDEHLWPVECRCGQLVTAGGWRAKHVSGKVLCTQHQPFGSTKFLVEKAAKWFVDKSNKVIRINGSTITGQAIMDRASHCGSVLSTQQIFWNRNDPAWTFRSQPSNYLTARTTPECNFVGFKPAAGIVTALRTC